MKLLEDYVIHDTLNPNIWENDKLKKDVRDRIISIVQLFQTNSEIPLYALDAQIVGSNAGYNYSDTSDIDVHIITNFENYDSTKDIVQAYFNAYKTNFNKSYDFKIKENPIELYVEDVMSSVISNGIYSVLEDKWIKYPDKNYYPKINIDISKQVEAFKKEITKAINSNNPELIEELINRLYMLRKNSLATDGEFSIGNLIFKEIRNIGLLDKLKDETKKIKSNELSLEELSEGMFVQRFDVK